MRFSCSVDVNVSVDEAVKLFLDREKQPLWQKGLIEIEQQSGEPMAVGSEALLHFKQGKNEFDLYEKVLVNQLPDEFLGEYETPRICRNTMKVRFQDIGQGQTRFESEIEYEFISFFVKLMAFVMPRMFRKQVQNYLDAFKELAEKGAGV